jgi:hypothetical protein
MGPLAVWKFQKPRPTPDFQKTAKTARQLRCRFPLFALRLFVVSARRLFVNVCQPYQ